MPALSYESRSAPELIVWEVFGGAMAPVGTCTPHQLWPIRAVDPPQKERKHFIDKLLVRIHFIIEMIIADRPCALWV